MLGNELKRSKEKDDNKLAINVNQSGTRNGRGRFLNNINMNRRRKGCYVVLRLFFCRCRISVDMVLENSIAKFDRPKCHGRMTQKTQSDRKSDLLVVFRQSLVPQCHFLFGYVS